MGRTAAVPAVPRCHHAADAICDFEACVTMVVLGWLWQCLISVDAGIVKNKGSGKLWEYVTYLVFDAPGLDLACEERQAHILACLSGASKPTHAAAVTVQQCTGREHLEADLKTVRAKGGEGLMLRAAGSKYEHKR